MDPTRDTCYGCALRAEVAWSGPRHAGLLGVDAAETIERADFVTMGSSQVSSDPVSSITVRGLWSKCSVSGSVRFPRRLTCSLGWLVRSRVVKSRKSAIEA